MTKTNFNLKAFAFTVDASLRKSAVKAEETADKRLAHADTYIAETPDKLYNESLGLKLDVAAQKAGLTAFARRDVSTAHRAALDAGTFATVTNEAIRRKLHDARQEAWTLRGKDRKAAVAELRIMARRELKAAMTQAAEAAAANGAKS